MYNMDVPTKYAKKANVTNKNWDTDTAKTEAKGTRSSSRRPPPPLSTVLPVGKGKGKGKSSASQDHVSHASGDSDPENEPVVAGKIIPGRWENIDLPKDYMIHQIVLRPDERPPHDRVHHREEREEYEHKFWSGLLDELQLQQSLSELETLVKTCDDYVFDPLPRVLSDMRFDTDPICLLTVETLPKDVTEGTSWGPGNAYPIRTSPDGNCFFHAISRLVYGDGDRHAEMRVRCVVEGIRNGKRYTSEKYLNQHKTIEDRKKRTGGQRTMGGFIVRNTVSWLGQTKVNSLKPAKVDNYNTIFQAYEQETMRMCKSGQYAGIWQIHQMVHVLLRPIRVHYPDQTLSLETALVKEYRRVFQIDEELNMM